MTNVFVQEVMKELEGDALQVIVRMESGDHQRVQQSIVKRFIKQHSQMLLR